MRFLRFGDPASSSLRAQPVPQARSFPRAPHLHVRCGPEGRASTAWRGDEAIRLRQGAGSAEENAESGSKMQAPSDSRVGDSFCEPCAPQWRFLERRGGVSFASVETRAFKTGRKP